MSRHYHNKRKFRTSDTTLLTLRLAARHRYPSSFASYVHLPLSGSSRTACTYIGSIKHGWTVGNLESSFVSMKIDQTIGQKCSSSLSTPQDFAAVCLVASSICSTNFSGRVASSNTCRLGSSSVLAPTFSAMRSSSFSIFVFSCSVSRLICRSS
jgi:hypothetical protein